MTRKRFNLEERDILLKRSDTLVEWQNVTQWHEGELATGRILKEEDGWEYVWVLNHARTLRLSYGDMIMVSPGHIREHVRVDLEHERTGSPESSPVPG